VHCGQKNRFFLLWKKGGKASEDFLITNLSDYFSPISGSKDYGYSSGNVIIYSVKIDEIIDKIKDDCEYIDKLQFWEILENISKDKWLKILS
jgi:hypothetical protein